VVQEAIAPQQIPTTVGVPTPREQLPAPLHF